MSNTFGNLDNTVEIGLSGTRLSTSGFDRPFSLSSEKRLKISGGGSGFVQIFADVNNNGVVEGGIDVILQQQSLDVLANNPIAQNLNPGNYIFRAASFDVQSEAPYQINLEIDPSDYLFDASYYRSVNADLAGLSDVQAFDHFAEYGLRERRQFSPFVDLAVYATSNPDLRAAGLVFSDDLYEHLVNYGVAEGRIFSNAFDAGFYRNNNADLAAAGFNNEQLFDHFRNFGVAEGRLGKAPETTVVISDPSILEPGNSDRPNISSSQQAIQSNEGSKTETVVTTKAPIVATSDPPDTPDPQDPLDPSDPSEDPQTEPEQTPGIDPVTGMTFEERVVDLTNQFREENGLAPLTVNTQLTNAAERHSQDIAISDIKGHVGSDGSSVCNRAMDAGYPSTFVGENVHYGSDIPAEAVEGWKNSPLHRDNMLNPDVTEIGVGYFFLENDTGNLTFNHYWTQVFGSPLNSFESCDDILNS